MVQFYNLGIAAESIKVGEVNVRTWAEAESAIPILGDELRRLNANNIVQLRVGLPAVYCN